MCPYHTHSKGQGVLVFADSLLYFAILCAFFVFFIILIGFLLIYLALFITSNTHTHTHIHRHSPPYDLLPAYKPSFPLSLREVTGTRFVDIVKVFMVKWGYTRLPWTLVIRR